MSAKHVGHEPDERGSCGVEVGSQLWPVPIERPMSRERPQTEPGAIDGVDLSDNRTRPK